MVLLRSGNMKTAEGANIGVLHALGVSCHHLCLSRATDSIFCQLCTQGNLHSYAVIRVADNMALVLLKLVVYGTSSNSASRMYSNVALQVGLRERLRRETCSPVVQKSSASIFHCQD